jgi:hypothetical protein
MKCAKRGGVRVLVEPFADIHEIIKATDKDNWLKVNIAIGFGDLLGLNIDGLNCHIDDVITGGDYNGSLEGISYRIVGHVTGNKNQCSGMVILEVSANAEPLIEENLDAESAAREDGEDEGD